MIIISAKIIPIEYFEGVLNQHIIECAEEESINIMDIQNALNATSPDNMFDVINDIFKEKLKII